MNCHSMHIILSILYPHFNSYSKHLVILYHYFRGCMFLFNFCFMLENSWFTVLCYFQVYNSEIHIEDIIKINKHTDGNNMKLFRLLLPSLYQHVDHYHQYTIWRFILTSTWFWYYITRYFLCILCNFPISLIVSNSV